jgi:hypothetical protein
VAAVRGEEDRAETLARVAESEALPTGASAVLAEVQLARGLSALGGGRFGEAYEHFRRLLDRDDPAYHYVKSTWSIGDLAEAAVHSGHREDIAGTMSELEALSAGTPSPQLRVALAYARPLLAADGSKEALFLAGLGADLTDWPFAGPACSSPTAHGSAGTGASQSHADRCARPETHSTTLESIPGASEPAKSSAPPARQAAGERRTHVIS